MNHSAHDHGPHRGPDTRPDEELLSGSGGRGPRGGAGRRGPGRGSPVWGAPGWDEPAGSEPDRPRGRGRRGGGERPGPRGRHGRRRTQRGAVRAAILSQLADAPSNGYGLIRSISERTAGAWTPSPGSIYPTLQQLVDEGLVEPVGADPRSDYRLTDAGAAHVAAHAAALDRVWQRASEPAGGLAVLDESAAALHGAAQQVRRTGSPDQVARAATELDRARRALYGILAEEPDGATGPGGDEGATGPGGDEGAAR